MQDNYERLQRSKKLLALSDAVLVGGNSFTTSQAHLEDKIAARLEKTFVDANEQEQEIIDGLKRKNLKFVETKFKRHNDGELFVQVQQNIREKDVHLWYKFDDKVVDVMELYVACDAIKRAGARSITCYFPYIPWLRQDKKDDGRVPISAKLYFDLLKASGGSPLKRIVSFDVHAEQVQGFFDGPFDALKAMPEFAAYYRDRFEDLDDVVVAACDAGGAARARYLAQLLGLQYTVFDKIRTGHGEAHTQEHYVVPVAGKKVIIPDDMIDSSGSLTGQYERGKPGLVHKLQALGAEVHVCATHAVFSAKNGVTAEQRLKQAGVEVVTTDSLPKPEGYYEQHKQWLTVISLDYCLANVFYCNQVGESISAFLRNREQVLTGQKLNFRVNNCPDGLYEIED